MWQKKQKKCNTIAEQLDEMLDYPTEEEKIATQWLLGIRGELSKHEVQNIRECALKQDEIRSKAQGNVQDRKTREARSS